MNIVDAVSVLAQRRKHELWYSESILTSLKIFDFILQISYLIYLFLLIQTESLIL